MKHKLLLLFAILYSASLYAQTETEKTAWKPAPEFTVRMHLSLFEGGHDITGGVRLNKNWTVGILGGYLCGRIDAVPADYYAINTAACVRGYLHLGKKDIFALYGDILAGASWVFKVTGNDLQRTRSISVSEGDVHLLLSFEPGVRIRFYKNIHFFIGPSFSPRFIIGAHAGIGF